MTLADWSMLSSLTSARSKIVRTMCRFIFEYQSVCGSPFSPDEHFRKSCAARRGRR